MDPFVLQVIQHGPTALLGLSLYTVAKVVVILWRENKDLQEARLADRDQRIVDLKETAARSNMLLEKFEEILTRLEKNGPTTPRSRS